VHGSKLISANCWKKGTGFLDNQGRRCGSRCCAGAQNEKALGSRSPCLGMCFLGARSIVYDSPPGACKHWVMVEVRGARSLILNGVPRTVVCGSANLGAESCLFATRIWQFDAPVYGTGFLRLFLPLSSRSMMLLPTPTAFAISRIEAPFLLISRALVRSKIRRGFPTGRSFPLLL
jgi:hypothetical protein